MIRILILLALILSACTGIPKRFLDTWCYTYDLTNPQSSNGTPAFIQNGTLTTNGIQSVNGFVYVNIAESFSFNGNATTFEITIFNQGDSFTGYLNGAIFALELEDYRVFVPSGKSIARMDATSGGYSGIYANFASYDDPVRNFYFSKARIYGTGTNPYPRNDCSRKNIKPIKRVKK